MKAFPVQAVDFVGSNLRIESLPMGVKRLVLARPQVRNAFDETMMSEMRDQLRRLAVEPSPQQMRVLVVTGEGSGFSAGADVGYMRRLAARGEKESLEDARKLAGLFHELAAFPTPVVGAVRGAAMGGAFGLLVCMDYVLADERAVFATSEVRLGIVPGVISPYIVRRLGLAHAASLMMSGRRIGAEEAARIGLVQAVAAPADFDILLQETVLELLRAGPHAARRTKSLLRRARPLPEEALIEFTAQQIAQARCSDEGRAGLQSFFDKKPPPWAKEVVELQERLRRERGGGGM